MMEFQQSKEWLERARRVIPGGISSNIRAQSVPRPLFYDRAAGSHIWDVDGNEYIDYVLGQGPMLLGHSPRPVIDAVQAQAQRGLVFAAQTELEVRAAERICELVPCAEMVRFSSTGSEAVHAALRLARAATGRKRILRFEGHYHGWYDTIAWNHAALGAELGSRPDPLLRASSLGQAEEDAANLLVLPWNDLDLVNELFEKRGREIAAVITEPILCNWCAIMPRTGFLEGLRQLCDEYGSLLVFDEVITGFRMALGGAQQLLGVTPDLATFAKAFGGGVVVSAVAGKEEYMRLFGELKTVHAGTYNANPVSMAAALAALTMLSENHGGELKKAHTASGILMKTMAGLGSGRSAGLVVRGVPPVFHVSFVPEHVEEIVDFRTSLQTDFDLTRRFGAELHRRGIRVTERGIWFVSTAHTQQDVDQTLAAVADSLAAM